MEKHMFLRTVCLTAALAVGVAFAADKPEIFSDSNSAIRGYDPVGYFLQSQPVKGSEQFSYQWKGAIWRFASTMNRDRFAASPEKYAPQYGGYCSYAVANGYTASIDPEAWTVREGKLYSNCSKSVREKWLQDVAGYIRKADANWPGVLAR
jgi:YHS domain-containing protein